MFNVIICGTPGTGKSSIIDLLRADTSLSGFNFISLSQFAKDKGCISDYDEVLETDVLDEEKLLEELKFVFKEHQFNIIESIHADILPSELVTNVFVCRTDNTKLYDRLVSRGYKEQKLSNNLEAEIFQTIYDEALEYFDSSLVVSLINNEKDELETNAKLVIDCIKRGLESMGN